MLVITNCNWVNILKPQVNYGQLEFVLPGSCQQINSRFFHVLSNLQEDAEFQKKPIRGRPTATQLA